MTNSINVRELPYDGSLTLEKGVKLIWEIA